PVIGTATSTSLRKPTGPLRTVHDHHVATGGSEAAAGPDAVLAREAAMARLLLDAARRFGETLVPDRVYDRFHEILADAVPHDGVVVSAYDPQDETIRCEYAWVDGERLAPEIFPPLKLGPEGRGMQSTVIHTGE